MQTIVLIDATYFVYWHYHAILSKNSTVDPVRDPIFVSIFKQSFQKCVSELCDNLGLRKDRTLLLAAKDGDCDLLWRRVLWPDYKVDTVSNKDKEQERKFRHEFLEMVFASELFKTSGVKHVLHHPRLEADDCIALAALQALRRSPDVQIIVISNHTAFLQLTGENRVVLRNLFFRDLGVDKDGERINADVFLFTKVAMGDPPKNIPPFKERCSKAAAMRYFADPLELSAVFKENKDTKRQFYLNQKLIDFHHIPKPLESEFLANPIFEP